MKIKNKSEGIQYGRYFIENEVIHEFLRYEIDLKPKGDEKEYLIYKWEEGKVFPSEETWIKYFQFVYVNKDHRNEILQNLRMIKEQNNESSDQIGSFIYISAILTLLKKALTEYYVKKTLKWKDMDPFFEFIPDTIQTSKGLKVKPPKIKIDHFHSPEIVDLDNLLDIWLENLVKKAGKKPFGTFLKKYILFKPGLFGMGVHGDNIIEDSYNRIKNFLKKQK